MIENILHRFYYYEKKQELHYIATYRIPQQKGEFPVLRVWVWNYNQGRSWINISKNDIDYRYPNREDVLEGDEIKRYLSPIKEDFFQMLFNPDTYK